MVAEAQKSAPKGLRPRLKRAAKASTKKKKPSKKAASPAKPAGEEAAADPVLAAFSTSLIMQVHLVLLGILAL